MATRCGRCKRMVPDWAIYNAQKTYSVPTRKGTTEQVEICGDCIEHVDRTSGLANKAAIVADPKET